MNLAELSLQNAFLLAATIGVAGPVLAGLSTRALGQHALFADLLRTQSGISGEQATGPWGRAFAPFVNAGSGSLPLSPDAIAAGIRDSLEKTRETALGRLRPWSYLPLLVGLLITSISLRELLELTRGQATADVQQLTGEMGQALLGTVAGVTAALLASLMQVVWAGRINSAAATAHRYLYQVFVPALPNVRVKLQFDQEVMDVLIERTAAVVDTYRQALQPLVEPLAASATDSAKAAAVAQVAFAEVAAAVKGARGLTDACAKLASASQYSEQAALVLSRQVESIQELVARSSEHQAAASRASEAVSKGVGELAGAVTALKSAVVGSPGSITAVAVDIAAGVKDTKGVIGHLAQASEGLGTEVGVLREAIANLGDARVEKWTAEVRASIAAIKEGLTENIAGIPARTAQEMDRLGSSAQGTAGAVGKVRTELQQIEEALERIGTAMANTAIPSPPRTGPAPEQSQNVDLGPVLKELQMGARHNEEILRTQREIYNVLAARFKKRRRFRWNPFLRVEA